jgi:HEAT repeat protein
MVAHNRVLASYWHLIGGTPFMAALSDTGKSISILIAAIWTFTGLTVSQFALLENVYGTPPPLLQSGTTGEDKSAQKVQALITTLWKGDSIERHQAAVALGATGDASAVEPLIKALEDSDDFLRSFAAKSLGKLGDKRAVLPLIKTLGDKQVLVRCSAARALGNLKDKRALGPLIQALKSDHYLVRRDAARALGDLGDPEAIDPLIEALGDKDSFIQNGAEIGLNEIGSPALPKLQNVLCDWTIGPRAAEILKHLNWQPSSNEESIHFEVAMRNRQFLLDHWETAKRILIGDTNGSRADQIQNAVFALIGLGKEEVVEELIRILNEKGSLKMAMAFYCSGNKALAAAAQSWSLKHEADVKSTGEDCIVEWGGMRAS